MNSERIRQLAVQAGISWKDQAELGVWTAFDCELEQFAQLIVKECAGIYDMIDNGNLHMGTDNYPEALRRTFFGVEL